MAHQKQFQTVQTNIVTISFGTAYWANVWLSETQSPYPLLLDQSHRSYQAYGLESSMLKSWGAKNLLYYAKGILRGETLKENRGDTHQLGGDFIVDQHGICHFAHPSQDPTDRPTIDHVLQAIGSRD